jgi:hypothetical protein
MWWQYLVAAVVVIVAVYGFCSIVGVETRWLTRRTDRTAENMYGSNEGLNRRQRREAERHRDADQHAGPDDAGISPRAPRR